VSRTWRIVIGVIAALVVVAAIGLVVAGMVFRSRGFGPARGYFGYRGQAGQARQLELRLLDDNGDGMPDRGVMEMPQPGFLGRTWGPGRSGWGRPAFPFVLLGLSHLAFPALLIGLVVCVVNRRRRAYPAPPSEAAEAK